MSGFNSDVFLQRIGLPKETKIKGDNLASLKLLVKHMVTTLPFEQLDCVLGRGIDVDPDICYQKIVVNHRGGYCFELNALLQLALQEYGFTKVVPRLARVLMGGFASGFTHVVSVVTIDNKPYLCDVGFGGTSMRQPIPLYNGEAPVCAFPEVVRVVPDNGQYLNPGGYQVQVFDALKWHKKGMPDNDKDRFWRSQYCFHPEQPCFESDIMLGNHWVSTKIDGNWFMNGRLAVQLRMDGHTQMQGTMLVDTKRTNNQDIKAFFGDEIAKSSPSADDSIPPFTKESSQIQEEDYFETLQNSFGINLEWDHRTWKTKQITLNDFIPTAIDKQFSFM